MSLKLPFKLVDIPQNIESYQFGHVIVHRTQVFAKTALSFAFTNIKPLLPGHSLVSPIRVVPRFKDLTREELLDFSSLLQVVAKSLEQMYDCTSVSMAIQDGPDAGQTIPHVHAHLLPRKKRDMDDPDSLYSKLDNQEGVFKTAEEMEKVAEETKKYIKLTVESKFVECLK